MVEDKNMVIEEAEEEYLELDKEHPDQGRVPVIRTMNDYILSNHMGDILKGINASLKDGSISEYLDLPVLTESLSCQDIHPDKGMKFYDINRTDMIADIPFWTVLRVLQNGKEVEVAEDLGCSLRFSFAYCQITCEYDSTWDLFNVPNRSLLPELDSFLTLYIGKSVLELRSDYFWLNYYEAALHDPKLRTASNLIKHMGIILEKSTDLGTMNSCLYFRCKPESQDKTDEEMKELEEKRNADVIKVVMTEEGKKFASDLDLYTHCVRYEYQYKFFILQGLACDDFSQLPREWLPLEQAKKIAKAMKFISGTPRRLAYSIMMPSDFMRDYINDKYKEAAEAKRFFDYFNHEAARLETIGKMFHNEYPDIWFRWIRTRFLQLGHSQARGIFNSTDGHQVDAYAFSDDELASDKYSVCIGYRYTMLHLFNSDSFFRKIMETGDYVFADGLIARNHPDCIINTARGIRPSPRTNKNADYYCLRFKTKWIPKGKYVRYSFGKENYELATSSSTTGTAYDEEVNASREALVERLKANPSFHETLQDLINSKSSVHKLAAESTLPREYIQEMCEKELEEYCPDEIFALCVGLHLEPYLSFVLYEKAHLSLPEDEKGKIPAFRRAMLCCLFKENMKNIKEYIEALNDEQRTAKHIPPIEFRRR